MIMQGNTPRSLTWPGCLAVLTLGLTCLPMLPSLHGEQPSKEEAQKAVEQAAKQLERAKEDLKAQEDILKRKMKDLIQAQRELSADSVRAARLQLDKHQGQLWIAEGKAAIRIEITLPVDERARTNDIVEKIRKSLPDELKGKIAVHIVPEIHRARVAPATGETTAPPRSSTPRPKPLPGNVPSADSDFVAPSKASDKRINDLEKKLEKVLDELQELRKQMKKSRGGAGYAPEAVSPPATGYAPPANPLPYAAPRQVAPPGVNPLPPRAPAAPSVPTPPAATPAPAPENPAAVPDPSAHRTPNPYRDREYRCKC